MEKVLITKVANYFGLEMYVYINMSFFLHTLYRLPYLWSASLPLDGLCMWWGMACSTVELLMH